MALRYERQYKTKRGDNLGDPDWHNRRWQDIDLRMSQRELDATKIDDAVDRLEAVALARLNDQLGPIIGQAIARLKNFGLLFTAHSHTERTMELGTLQFVVAPEERESYVATGFVIIRPVAQLDVGMSCRTLSYDNGTGELIVSCYSVIGSGTFDHWSIGVTGDPDLAHATRTDNPHQVTAAQVGAYSKAEADDKLDLAIGGEVSARNSAITANINALVGSAPGALNTLNELAAALGSDPNFATTMTTQLGHRVRFDQGQTLSAAEKAQVGLNIGGTAPNDAVALDSMARLPPVNAEALTFVNKHPQGRLSIHATQVFPTDYVYANRFVYYRPHVGCHVPLYESSAGGFRYVKFTAADGDVVGLSLNMVGGEAYWPAYMVFDVFVTYVAGVPRLGTGPMWASNSGWGTYTRPAAGVLITYQGLQINNQSMQLRYGPNAGDIATIPPGLATWLGTIMTAEQNGWLRFDYMRLDSSSFPAMRCVWNKYNQLPWKTCWTDPAGSWSYQASWAPSSIATGGAGGSYIQWVVGEDSAFNARYYQFATPDPSTPGNSAIFGIGMNATSGPTGQYAYGWPSLSMSHVSSLDYRFASPGAHYVCALTYSPGGITTGYGTYPNELLTLDAMC